MGGNNYAEMRKLFESIKNGTPILLASGKYVPPVRSASIDALQEAAAANARKVFALEKRLLKAFAKADAVPTADLDDELFKELMDLMERGVSLTRALRREILIAQGKLADPLTTLRKKKSEKKTPSKKRASAR